MIQTSHKQTIRPRAADTCSNRIDGDGGLATSSDVSYAIGSVFVMAGLTRMHRTCNSENATVTGDCIACPLILTVITKTL